MKVLTSTLLDELFVVPAKRKWQLLAPITAGADGDGLMNAARSGNRNWLLQRCITPGQHSCSAVHQRSSLCADPVIVFIEVAAYPDGTLTRNLHRLPVPQP